MDGTSVNVESRTSSQDKRWTIMAALLGTNTAFMLFQGIAQETNPKFIREIALAIIAATIPFQGIYFLIYTFLLEHDGELSQDRIGKLKMASAICQVISYMSLIGLGMMWFNISIYVGVAFFFSTALAIILIRSVISPVTVDDA
jgi:predicted permease